MSPIDFGRFDVLTFDCYGTLIDWEAGILAGLRAVLDPRGVVADDEDLLVRYARHEAAAEAGPYLRYREVLARGLAGVCAELGVTPAPTPGELAAFGGSVADWPAFPDSADALARLHGRYKLAVITNCDDDLFAASARRLATDFDFVITAQQCGSYKPSVRNFEVALERIDRPRDRILHVAQSLFHDHVPAKAMGLTSAWIDRRHDRPGSGATPPASAVPDLVVPSMAAFADLAAGSATTRRDAAARVRAQRQTWRELVAAVGPARTEEPGPMGDWSFRELAGHLAGWRDCRCAQLEAAARGGPDAPPPWPARLEDLDEINDWIRDRDRDRPTDDLIAAYDASFERLASAIEALPERLFDDPAAFPWTGGIALRDADFTEHLREEHEPQVRAWLAGVPRVR